MKGSGWNDSSTSQRYEILVPARFVVHLSSKAVPSLVDIEIYALLPPLLHHENAMPWKRDPERVVLVQETK